MHRIDTNADTIRDHPAPLYRVYPRETHPQPAYIELDPQARHAEVAWNAEIGDAVPMCVWHGLRLRYTVDHSLSGQQIADLLEDDEVQALMERVCVGHTVEWDGGNDVGRLSDDAQEAHECLVAMLYQVVGEAEIWDADYIAEGAREDDRVTAETTDAELATIADDVGNEAEAQHAYLPCDVLAILEMVRDRMRDD